MAKSAATLEFLQSPLDSVLHILPHGHEKALRHAFYNAAAFVFILILFSAGIAVYFVLEAFIQPLVWAVLCGTVLFPFKHALTKLVQQWLSGLAESGTPLFVGAVALPIQVLDSSSEGLANIITRWLKPLIGLAIGLPLSYLAYYFLDYVWTGLENAASVVNDVLNCFSAFWVWTIVLAYLLIVIFWWNDTSKPILSALSVPVWAILLVFFATMTGPFKVTLSVLSVIIIGVGLSTYMKEKAVALNESNTSSCSLHTFSEASASAPENLLPNINMQRGNDELESGADTAKPEQDTTDGVQRPLGLHIPKCTGPDSTSTRKKSRNLSNQYIISLVWMCVLLKLWMHMWWLQLLPIPVLVWVLKRLVTETGALDFTKQKVRQRWSTMQEWVQDREDALVPHYIRGILSLCLKGDKKLITILSGSLDKIISIFIILSVFVSVVIAAFLVSIQIQQESMYLVQVSGSLINETVSNHPELKTWLPGADDMHSAVDSMVGNLHRHGRDWISTKIHNTFDGHIDDVSFLEKQILEMWDQIYMQWAAKNVTGLESRKSNVVTSWNTVVNSFSKLDNLHITGIMTYIQDNIETVKSIAESVWTVLKGNINIVFTILTTSISLIFGGGTALLNLVISFVSSWLPLIYKFLNIKFDMLILKFNVLFSIFLLSLLNALLHKWQMLNHHGNKYKIQMSMQSWMWLLVIDTVRNIKIYNISSTVLGLCLGAVPFLGTYWAAVPGMIELLVKDQKILAIGLLVIHFLPSSFVDTIIYADIKGGSHPYVTGLAVAGGIYYFGLKGAIIGPMLLCFLLVAFNIYSAVINSPPPTTPAAERPPVRRVRSVLQRSDTIT
ncbi:transmembrane protein 245-like [Anneissia japonica]|uniref:transmembrane protein 245-like n=1 Tax=Anneissia japonica TaxID=1529436 RepID=UPI0014259999|nr:transmembrane protein 245-like [Anneissia japonica]